MKGLIARVVLGLVVAGLTLTVRADAQPAVSAEASPEAGGPHDDAAMASLATRARASRTPAEHAIIARDYRLRAEALDAQAAAHETRLDAMAVNRSPMAFKWPALAAPGLNRARQEAAAARRAAGESRVLAERRLRLSVEALAHD